MLGNCISESFDIIINIHYNYLIFIHWYILLPSSCVTIAITMVTIISTVFILEEVNSNNCLLLFLLQIFYIISSTLFIINTNYAALK